MVIIWLMMVNNNLVGGAITILKHMSSSMGRMTSQKNEMENKIHGWNHQAVSHISAYINIFHGDASNPISDRPTVQASLLLVEHLAPGRC